MVMLLGRMQNLTIKRLPSLSPDRIRMVTNSRYFLATSWINQLPEHARLLPLISGARFKMLALKTEGLSPRGRVQDSRSTPGRRARKIICGSSALSATPSIYVGSRTTATSLLLSRTIWVLSVRGQSSTWTYRQRISYTLVTKFSGLSCSARISREGSCRSTTEDTMRANGACRRWPTLSRLGWPSCKAVAQELDIDFSLGHPFLAGCSDRVQVPAHRLACSLDSSKRFRLFAMVQVASFAFEITKVACADPWA